MSSGKTGNYLRKHCAEAKTKQGLPQAGVSNLEQFTFEFDGAKTRRGVTKYDRNVTSISTHLLAHGEAKVLETPRHEAAHAIVGGEERHGDESKRVNIQLGRHGCD